MEKVKSYIKKYFRPFIRGNNPDFMIIGAQKCGTTSLHYYLGQHPKLVGTLPKELHYFDQEINHGHDLNWYKSNFFHFSIHKPLFFEATPSYLYDESIAKQVKELFPDIKLIVLLRDPIDRAFSAYSMYKKLVERRIVDFSRREIVPGEVNPIYKAFVYNRQNFPTFQEAIDIELEIIEKNAGMEPALLRRGLYAQQLKSWLKYVDREQMLVLRFSDLVQDLPNTLSDIFRFLNVQEVPMSSINKEPRHKGAYSSTLGENERDFLVDFYAEPNKELKELLGWHQLW